MRYALTLLALVFATTATAQPADLQALTDSTWEAEYPEDWQIYSTSSGDSAWVWQDTLWYARIGGAKYVHCSFLDTGPFHLHDLKQLAEGVLEGEDAYDLDGPLSRHVECITTYAAIRDTTR